MKVYCAGAESKPYQWALSRVTELALESFVWLRDHPTALEPDYLQKLPHPEALKREDIPSARR